MKKYIKQNNLLNSINDKIKVVFSLPVNGIENEIIIVKFDGFYKYSNNTWNKILGFNSSGSGSPIGELRATVNPNGIDTTKWLECNGQTFDTSVFSQLYTHLGSNKVPDLRGMTLVGIGTNSTDSIATHDSFTLGQVKQPQIQDHAHCFLLSNNRHTHNINMKWCDETNTSCEITGTGHKHGPWAAICTATCPYCYMSTGNTCCRNQCVCTCNKYTSTSSMNLGCTSDICLPNKYFDFYLCSPTVATSIGTVVDAPSGPIQSYISMDVFPSFGFSSLT